MENDPVPFDPTAGRSESPASPSAASPAPRPRWSPRAWVVAILVFDVLVASVVWFALAGPGSPSAPSSVGRTTQTVPLPPGIESGLRDRIARNYPGNTVADVTAISYEDTAAAGGERGVSAYFTMRNAARPAFQFQVVYSAPGSGADDLSAYTSNESFFRVDAVPEQPVDSFIEMWLHEHPGQECFYVTEDVGMAYPDRIYVVGYTRYEQDGYGTKRVDDVYFYHYFPATGTWKQTASFAKPEPGTITGSDTTAGSDYWTPGNPIEDTDTVVASALPGFEYVATERDSLDNPTLTIRSVKYPKVRAVVYRFDLEGGLFQDGIVTLFTGKRTKVDAFLKAFSSRYPDSVIWEVIVDPEGTDNDDVVDVWIEPSDEIVRFRYNAKTHVWTEVE